MFSLCSAKSWKADQQSSHSVRSGIAPAIGIARRVAFRRAVLLAWICGDATKVVEHVHAFLGTVVRSDKIGVNVAISLFQILQRNRDAVLQTANPDLLDAYEPYESAMINLLLEGSISVAKRFLFELVLWKVSVPRQILDAPEIRTLREKYSRSNVEKKEGFLFVILEYLCAARALLELREAENECPGVRAVGEVGSLVEQFRTTYFCARSIQTLPPLAIHAVLSDAGVTGAWSNLLVFIRSLESFSVFAPLAASEDLSDGAACPRGSRRPADVSGLPGWKGEPGMQEYTNLTVTTATSLWVTLICRAERVRSALFSHSSIVRVCDEFLGPRGPPEFSILFARERMTASVPPLMRETLEDLTHIQKEVQLYLKHARYTESSLIFAVFGPEVALEDGVNLMQSNKWLLWWAYRRSTRIAVLTQALNSLTFDVQFWFGYLAALSLLDADELTALREATIRSPVRPSQNYIACFMTRCTALSAIRSDAEATLAVHVLMILSAFILDPRGVAKNASLWQRLVQTSTAFELWRSLIPRDQPNQGSMHAVPPAPADQEQDDDPNQEQDDDPNQEQDDDPNQKQADLLALNLQWVYARNHATDVTLEALILGGSSSQTPPDYMPLWKHVAGFIVGAFSAPAPLNEESERAKLVEPFELQSLFQKEDEYDAFENFLGLT